MQILSLSLFVAAFGGSLFVIGSMIAANLEKVLTALIGEGVEVEAGNAVYQTAISRRRVRAVTPRRPAGPRSLPLAA